MSLHRWPPRVWIVRHGESLANVATRTAIERDLDRIDIRTRDIDVPLSERGEAQARAVGRWFLSLPPDARPERILCSPCVRASLTAHLVALEGQLDARIVVDERLRERDLGVLERMTHKSIHDLVPEQDELRGLLGKFYHRPPGGESWTDVILRLRSLLDTFAIHHDGRRLLIVCHQVVLLCFRYVFERLDEAAVMELDLHGEVGNGAVTEYEVRDDHGEARFKLLRSNFVPEA